MTQIGIIGLGRMGSAIAQRMQAQGHNIQGWTRSGHGVTTTADLASIVDACDTLILSLLDDAAVASVLDTCLAQDLSGKIIIDTSTVVPTILKGRIAQIEYKGAVAVDAPISGGPELVHSGGCGVFIGGSDAAATRAQATLTALSGRIFHVGPLGTGLVMKTINNSMLQCYFGGLDEVMPLAKRAGLSLETGLRILCGGPAGIPMVADRIPKILGDDKTVAFEVRAAYKDSDVFQRVVQAYGLTSPTLAQSAQRLKMAVEAGMGAEDPAALVSAA
jgi:3-hydroxyisobutyrate dehydrogenase-like beta-hydroxyacid dehydrogenase